ncbi:metallophosphoesterase [Archaeoglobus fulgidus]|uniref:Phosphoesterase n=1 Tax=Archaeoglobus fulgidus DSM 8774 TaxID=1344584 RepID=A0A075WBB1_ARCFL|nr:metallophosphoesterase [Archaeoglobus fulgidus]AIG97675.1 phosphoesterase family [Archaeoglobus fulgidus DSM 8774]
MAAMRILIFGDTHIPERADEIPREFTDYLEDFDMVVITGDLTSERVLRFAERVAESVIAVRGNMDDLPLPHSAKFRVEGLSFGVVHGHQVYPRGNREQLEQIALEMDVDVLISGHTHLPDVYRGAKILLNPGSMTGVWGGGAYSTYPSFMVLEVKKGSFRGSLYRLLDEEVTVEQFSF